MSKPLPATPFASQPNYHPVIEKTIRWMRSDTTLRTGRVGPDNSDERKYVSRKDLEKRLDARSVELLLDALFQDPYSALPDRDTIMKHYLRSFAILLCIGEGHMIYHFTRYQDLQDSHLPFPKEEPDSFPKSHRNDLYAAFRQEQWAFCAVKLEYGFCYNLGADEILPVDYIEKIEEGGSAALYKIRVDKDYDELIPLNEQRLDPEDQQCNIHVIKSYRTPDAEDYYNTELNAFTKLRFNKRPPPNIIEFMEVTSGEERIT